MAQTKKEREVREHLRREYESATSKCVEAMTAYLLDFDELHTLIDTRNITERVTVICKAQARRADKIIEDYLLILCGKHPSLLRDREYPIGDTLINNHERIARSAITRITQAKARGKSDKQIVRDVRGYLMRAFKHATDAVLYYESTRIAVDLELFDAPDDAFFRTICEHDDRTCEICLGIEAEQKKHPVPVSQKLTGVNAPPFHPFCRCRVEVIEP